MRRYRKDDEGSRDAALRRPAALPDLRQAHRTAASAFLLGALRRYRSRPLAQGQLPGRDRRATRRPVGRNRTRGRIAQGTAAMLASRAIAGYVISDTGNGMQLHATF